MAYTPITNLPTAPSRQEPATFSVQADAFLGALPTFGTQVNAAGDFIDGVGAQVTTDAATATAAAATAVNAANADEWVSGATYAEGDVVWSGIDYQTYRSKAAHSGITTDPAGDAVNWQAISSAAAAAPSGPTLQAVASGSLTDGSTVVVNANGTVSVVSGVEQGTGSPVVFEGASTSFSKAIFDSSNNKVVVVYQDDGNANFGTAVVGTVSGTSISFGTPVVFESATTENLSVTFDTLNNKVVIAYRDGGNSDFGTAIVGTVSGTSISFGTPVVFRSASMGESGCTFDSLNNKVVIGYQNPFTGAGLVRVGTVSGTSISFGTEVTFEPTSISSGPSMVFDTLNNKVIFAYRGASGFGIGRVGTVSGTSISIGADTTFESASTILISATFDSFNNKVVIAYRDGGNSNFGTAVVGTVSGTTMTYGPPVVFNSGITTPSCTFDTLNNKVVIAYQDGGNSNLLTFVAGTVSGTSISFGSQTVVGPTVSLDSNSIVFEPINNKTVVPYKDTDNSNFGTAAVFTTGSTNLTASNFLGFSDNDYASGETATIQLVGSVDDAQSGLTPAQKYYVQPTGEISTTVSVPEAYAGIAVAADKIIVKG